MKFWKYTVEMGWGAMISILNFINLFRHPKAGMGDMHVGR
jgi:hypothetical protein